VSFPGNTFEIAIGTEILAGEPAQSPTAYTIYPTSRRFFTSLARGSWGMPIQSKNKMCLGVVIKSFHASFRQSRDEPFVKDWDYGLPPNRRTGIKSFSLFAC